MAETSDRRVGIIMGSRSDMAAADKAVVVLTDPVTSNMAGRVIADLAIKNRLPLMCDLSEFTRAGALMSYGPSLLSMAQRSAAFLAMPGGVGTFEEFFEILTWAVLGLHQKPIGLLNIEHYFDPLLNLLNHAVAEGFVRPEHLNLILVSDDPESLATRLTTHQPPPSRGPMWIDIDQT